MSEGHLPEHPGGPLPPHVEALIYPSGEQQRRHAKATPEQRRAIRKGRDKIAAAAILREGVVWSVPKPGRHHDVIRLMAHRLDLMVGGGTQGFLTEAGVFLNRAQALRLASKNGQLLRGPRNVLTSEDLW